MSSAPHAQRSGKGGPSSTPRLFPDDLLSWNVSQCTSCGRLTLQGGFLGQILQELTREHLSDAQLLAGLRVHCAHSLVHDCAVCWHERAERQYCDQGQEFLALVMEQAAKDAARFYATPAYRERELRERHRLDQLVKERAQKVRPDLPEKAP